MSKPGQAIALDFTMDTKKPVKGLLGLQDNIGKAAKATAQDFRKRAPAWVSKAVRHAYTLKKDEFEKRSIKVKGIKKMGNIDVPNYEIIWKGKRLSLVHYRFTPTEMPEPCKRYRVTATIILKRKVNLGRRTFLQNIKKAPLMPWRRLADTRYPIVPIKTLALPQAITSDRADVEHVVLPNIEKRLENNMKRFVK